MEVKRETFRNSKESFTKGASLVEEKGSWHYHEKSSSSNTRISNATGQVARGVNLMSQIVDYRESKSNTLVRDYHSDKHAEVADNPDIKKVSNPELFYNKREGRNSHYMRMDVNLELKSEEGRTEGDHVPTTENLKEEVKTSKISSQGDIHFHHSIREDVIVTVSNPLNDADSPEQELEKSEFQVSNTYHFHNCQSVYTDSFNSRGVKVQNSHNNAPQVIHHGPAIEAHNEDPSNTEGTEAEVSAKQPRSWKGTDYTGSLFLEPVGDGVTQPPPWSLNHYGGFPFQFTFGLPVPPLNAPLPVQGPPWGQPQFEHLQSFTPQIPFAMPLGPSDAADAQPQYQPTLVLPSKDKIGAQSQPFIQIGPKTPLPPPTIKTPNNFSAATHNTPTLNNNHDISQSGLSYRHLHGAIDPPYPPNSILPPLSRDTTNEKMKHLEQLLDSALATAVVIQAGSISSGILTSHARDVLKALNSVVASDSHLPVCTKTTVVSCNSERREATKAVG